MLSGKPYQEALVAGEDPKDLTVGSVISNVLSTTKSANPIRSYVLAQKFFQNDEVEVTADDIVFIKTQLEDPLVGFFPYIIGQVESILES